MNNPKNEIYDLNVTSSQETDAEEQTEVEEELTDAEEETEVEEPLTDDEMETIVPTQEEPPILGTSSQDDF